MTNLDNEQLFDALQQARGKRSELTPVTPTVQDPTRIQKIRFFRPVCDLLGQLHDAGVRFPAGMIMSRTVANANINSNNDPRLSISIDTRRQMVLECVARNGILCYSAYIWEISSRSCDLITADIAALTRWLAERIAEFEYQPTIRRHPTGLSRTSMPPASPAEPFAVEDGAADANTPVALPPVPPPLYRPDGRAQRTIDLNE